MHLIIDGTRGILPTDSHLRHDASDGAELRQHCALVDFALLRHEPAAVRTAVLHLRSARQGCSAVFIQCVVSMRFRSSSLLS
jgi:hypothetical protein